MSDTERHEARDGQPADPAEQLEAARLSDALEAEERGPAPPLDPREEPELASLVSTAGLLRRTWSAIVPAAEYVARSRSLILGSMERAADARTRPSNVVPFYRRWSLWTPVASAAAAAAVTFAITTLAASDVAAPVQQPALASVVPGAEAAPIEPARPPLVEPAQPQALAADMALAAEAEPPSADEAPSAAADSEALVNDLKRIEAALQEIRERAELGESVDATLLRTVTEGTARVASQIATAPESVPATAVATYFHSVSPGRSILDSAQVVDGDETALETAQVATRDGLSVALRYFNAPSASGQ